MEATIPPVGLDEYQATWKEALADGFYLRRKGATSNAGMNEEEYLCLLIIKF